MLNPIKVMLDLLNSGTDPSPDAFYIKGNPNILNYLFNTFTAQLILSFYVKKITYP